MAVEIKTKFATANESTTINFDNTVLAYTVGLSHWSFTYESDDHHIETLSLNLQANSSGTQVAVKVTAVMSDDSGNHIKSSDSSVELTCIAVTGNADSNLSLANENNVGNGGSSAAIPLPGGGSTNIATAFLSGFDLSYGSDDHHLESMSITAGSSTAGTSGFVTGSAEMEDDSGNKASTAAINGAFVAQAAGPSTLVSKQVTNQQTSDTVTVDMGTPVTAAVAALQSMTVSFGSDDHHVKTIAGGCGAVTVRGSTVELAGAEATIEDGSGHKQNNSDSHVSITVFGLT